MISKEEASTVITNKHTLYGAFQRNKYYMPKYNEACITIKFLLGVREGRYFLPKTDNIKKRQCSDPPPKREIVKELARILYQYPDTVPGFSQEEAAAMRKTAAHLAKRPADVSWMLDIIATMDENHEYFKKDYIKPKKVVDDDEIV